MRWILSATQSNINLANDAAGNPTPNGAYNPDGGYNATGYGLMVVDYFAPSNLWELNLSDEDIGSGGVLLIPSTGSEAETAYYNATTQTYTIQNNGGGDPMLVTAGKEGRIYLLDANNLGGYNTAYDTEWCAQYNCRRPSSLRPCYW